MAVFAKDDNFLAFPIDALKEHLELCYAMTVHKAQGSEFDSVAVIMPNKDLPDPDPRDSIYRGKPRAPVCDYRRNRGNYPRGTLAQDGTLFWSARAN